MDAALLSVLARIARLYVPLVAARAVRRAGTMQQLGANGADREALALVHEALLLHALRAMSEEVAPLARVRPGRIFTRPMEIHRDAPRAAVHWPRTFARQLSQGEGARPSFIVRRARRQTEAPENVLLVLTLMRLARRAAFLGPKGAGGDERLLVRRFKAECDQTIALPSYSRCVELVEEIRVAGHEGVRALEEQTVRRLQATPPLAPGWAVPLLRLCQMLRWLPASVRQQACDTKVDRQKALWSLMAHLEGITALRALEPVREGREGKFSAGQATLVPFDRGAGWVLDADGQHNVGVRIDPRTYARKVWTSACEDLFFTRYRAEGAEEDYIDKWLVLHRCAKKMKRIVATRRKVEIRFFYLDPLRPCTGEIREWLTAVRASRE